MKYVHIVFIWLSVLLLGCSPVYTSLDFAEIPAKRLESDPLEDAIDWRMQFIGDAGNYLIFECQIINFKEQSLDIAYDDFWIETIENPVAVQAYKAINPLEHIEYLQGEKKSEKTRRKSGNILEGVLFGLEMVALAITPGANLIEGVFYGAERLAYFADANSASKEYERNLDEETQYFEIGVLYKERIYPGDTLVRDIVFPRIEHTGSTRIIGRWDGKDHSLLFDARQISSR